MLPKKLYFQTDANINVMMSMTLKPICSNIKQAIRIINLVVEVGMKYIYNKLYLLI